MATVNERLLEAAIAKTVDFQQYSNGVEYRMIALLNRVDADLIEQIRKALETLTPETFTVARLEALLLSARALNDSAYAKVNSAIQEEAARLARVEAAYHYSLFTQTLPEEVLRAVALVGVSGDQVYAAAMSRPFQGRLLKEWSSQIAEDKMRRIREAIRIGYAEGKTTDEIVRGIRGTRAKGYTDGVIEIDRRYATTIVNTALSHTAQTARDSFYEANQAIIKALQWTATLDSRTTPQCIVRDGKQYNAQTKAPIGHSIPWGSGPGRLHFRCRSVSVPVTKSWKELGADMPEFSPSTRASMDGQVPADLSYGQWFAKQSAERQDEIVGATRGQLFRQGGIKFDKFSNDKGRWLTLEELESRYKRGFERAGLLP